MTARWHQPRERVTSTRAKGPPKETARSGLEKSAGAVVFHRGTRLEYLLIFSTYWEFPKGLVEPDEKEQETALREVREETGLNVELLHGFREEITYFYRRGGTLIKKQVVYFLGSAQVKTVRVSREHRAAEWRPYRRALAELKYENARMILTKANEFLSKRIEDENPRD
jgi:bis(5'-nucleosidyl)-tetraphosphatase